MLPRIRLEDAHLNQLVILTFNFERSFERALWRALNAGYSDSEGAKRNVAQALMPIHIHGSLGQPKWIFGTGLDYGEGAADAPVIQKAAANLKLIYDDLVPEDHMQIGRALRGAKNVCFIAFGYSPDNMRKPGLDRDEHSNTVIRGTVKGLPLGQLQVLERSFRSWNEKGFGNNPFRSDPVTALKMLESLDYVHEW
jgi:hypothetical protein